MSNHRQSHRQSISIAFSGMIAALSVVLMLLGGIIPVMTYISPLIGGVLLLPVLLEFGKKYAWTCWGSAALIVLLLGVDREAAFFYLFFGWYPLVKWQIDRMTNKRICLLVKIALFSLLTAVMYSFLGFILHMDALIAEFNEMGVWMTALFMVMLVFCMMLFDRLLFPLCMLYENRIKPRLKVLRR